MSSIWPYQALNAKQNQSWELDILNFGFARRQVSGVARQTTPNQNEMVQKTPLILPTRCIEIWTHQKYKSLCFKAFSYALNYP